MTERLLQYIWQFQYFNNDDVDPEHNIPTLTLEDRVPKILLQQYFSWMKENYFIPCESSAGNAGDLVWTGWKERLMIERLERKSRYVLELLKKNNFHWEDTLWW